MRKKLHQSVEYKEAITALISHHALRPISVGYERTNEDRIEFAGHGTMYRASRKRGSLNAAPAVIFTRV